MRMFVVAVLLVTSGRVRADEDLEVHTDVLKALGEGRKEDAYDRLGQSIRAATAANDSARIGRLELFRAELEADKPSDRTVGSARKAMMYLTHTPQGDLAVLRYHISSGQLALSAGRVGAAALHVQEARNVLFRVLATLPTDGGKAPPPPLGTPDPFRDKTRLEILERSLTEALRRAVDDAAAGSVVPPGTLAALWSFGTRKPLESGPGDEPQPMPARTRLAYDQLRMGLDRSISETEEQIIAAAEARKDPRAAAAARSRHADTLLRLGRREEALEMRRAAARYIREFGGIDEILAEDRWVAEHASTDRRAVYQARREAVVDVERYVSKLSGPSRSVAAAKYRAEYRALVDAVAGLPSQHGAKAFAPEMVEAVDWLRDRMALDELSAFGDSASWSRAGAQAPDLRRSLEDIAHERLQRPDISRADVRAAAPGILARVADALAKGDAATRNSPIRGIEASDGAQLGARLGGRSLAVYGRLDADFLAVATIDGRGVPRMEILPLSVADEGAMIDALAQSLRRGDESWRDPAKKLYAALLAPIEEALPRAGYLEIVPDGGLSAVPFAALLDGQDRYFGSRVAVSLLPSLRWLQRPVPASLPDTASLIVTASRFAEAAFPSMQNGDREPNAIRSTLDAAGRKSRLFPSGGAADALLTDKGRYDVVHINTRARVDGDDPALSVVALTTSLLPAWSIAASSLRANVMVLDLPADTLPNQGGVQAGRGLFGLGAAVVGGPAPTAVLSLWPGSGPASAALLCRFYERYAAGESAPGALATAQREMASMKIEQPLLLLAGGDPLSDAKRFAHPRYWAPFVVFGGP